MDCTQYLQNGWHYRHVLFQPNEMAGWLFFISQLPNHLHYCLVQSLHQPISLWVVGSAPQFLYAKDLAHFLNYITHKVSTSITHEPDQGPTIRDVTLV